jgi:hypothetical protein
MNVEATEPIASKVVQTTDTTEPQRISMKVVGLD